MVSLLTSSTIPLWAASQQASKELGRTMTAFKALLHAEEDINRFLDNPPQLEDEIKQLLKDTSSGNNKVVEKLQLAQSTLT